MMKSTRRVLNGKETKIHSLLVQMTQLTEQSINDALVCFKKQDKQLANSVVKVDEEINKLQVDIEDECFTTIALHQPVASDLRDLISDTHVAVELERIADHAAAIAGIVIQMDKSASEPLVEQIVNLGLQTRNMLQNAMQAYHDVDQQKAREVAQEDDSIDHTEQQIIEHVFEQMKSGAEQFETATYTLWITHNLERIGDRVTNIAERTIFSATGKNLDLNRS